MSWRDNLQDASFRGVEFKVKEHTTSSGRRIKVTDRWQKRTTSLDLGPQLTVFDIEGYVIQSEKNDYNYFDERDALVNALNKRGAATLVHPFFGERKCHAEKFEVNETFDEGGIARFTITFLLEETRFLPLKSKDYIARVDEAAEKVSNFSADTFFVHFDAAVAFVESIATDIIKFMQNIQTAINRVNGAIESTINTAIGIVSTAIALVTTVLNVPCELYNTVKDAADSFKYLVGMAGDAVESGIIGGCSGSERTEGITLDGKNIPETLGTSIIDQMILVVNAVGASPTTVSSALADNQTLSEDISKILIVTLAMQIAIRIEFSSLEKMYAVLNNIIDSLESVFLFMGDQVDLDTNDFFTSLEDLRSVFVNSMIEKGATLKRTIDYQVPGGVQSVLELAYNKYNDLSRDEEIIQKNTNIQHPGFMPSGDTVQILES
jgi:prophage DNA circulation protein